MEMTAEDQDQDQDQQERAAAIAEVAAIPAIEPTNTNLNPSIRAANRVTGTGGTGGGGRTRVNEAADEAMQGGDLQNVDGPGAEVQAMFIEFLFGL